MKYCDLLFSINQIIEIYTIRMIVHYTCWINQNFALCLYLVEIGQMFQYDHWLCLARCLFNRLWSGHRNHQNLWSSSSLSYSVHLRENHPNVKRKPFVCVLWKCFAIKLEKSFPWIGGNTFLGLEEILEQLEVGAEEQRAPMGRRLSTVTTFTKLRQHFVNSKQPESLTPTW